jgi:hypothetical protein
VIALADSFVGTSGERVSSKQGVCSVVQAGVSEAGTLRFILFRFILFTEDHGRTLQARMVSCLRLWRTSAVVFTTTDLTALDGTAQQMRCYLVSK